VTASVEATFPSCDDVMAAARALKRPAAMSFTWSRTTRGFGAESGDIGRSRGTRDGRIDYTSALGIPRCAAYRRHYGRLTAVPWMPSGSCHHGSSARSSWAFSPCSSRAIVLRSRAVIRHIATFSRLGCEPVLIETSSETRHALTGDALLAHIAEIR